MRPWHLLVAILLAVRPDAALAEGPTPSQMQAGSLLTRMQHGYQVATLLNTDVDIVANGLVARVSVRQVFQNDGDEWVEGVYVFPLPDKAAVDRMRLYIGDRFIEGEIREKEQARKEYEQARQEGRKTSLLEQQRANVFTTSIANIAPGERVTVEIEYLEDLGYDSGTFRIRFPMTLTPRYIPGEPLHSQQGDGWSPDTTDVVDASLITPPMVSNSSGHRVALHASINAGVPLEIVASRYHPVSISKSDDTYSISLAGGQSPMNQDFELLWRPVPSAAPRAVAFSETVNGEQHHLLMVIPPDAQSDTAVRMPRELVLVVDTSGSMHGTSIEQARKALLRALAELHAGDRFNVIEFNSGANALFANSIDVTQWSIGTAENFVRGLRANGGTEMRPALKLAMRSKPTGEHLRQVIFITDGSVGNEEELYSLIEEKLGTARLFTIGIGSAPNSWFMRKAAELGRGTYTMIGGLHEVGEKMDRLFRKLENPQVTNIRADWPGGVIIESYPDIVPDLYLGEPVTIRARTTGGLRPGDVVSVSGDSVAGAWSWTVPLSASEQRPGIAALWARARIAALHDEQRRGADAHATRAAIVDTALVHHLVSKYTSLVAVDKTPVRPAARALSKEQIPNLLARGQDAAAIFGLPATATNAAAMRLSGLATIAAALSLMALQRSRRRTPDGVAR